MPSEPVTRSGQAGSAHPLMVAAAAPPTTVRSPFVTLQPTGPSGRIPGDANDGADFWGLGAALVAIVVIIVLARLAVHGRPSEPSRGER